MTTYINGEVSHWMKAGAAHVALRSRESDPALESFDLAIVGGGMTGLWAAYYAIKRDPSLRIAVIEAKEIGYGASGRNGGWLSTLIPGNRAVYARTAGGQAVSEFQREVIESITETLSVLEREGIEADQHQGGNLAVATTQAALTRLQGTRQGHLKYGYQPTEVQLLTEAEVKARINIAGAKGGLYYPQTARIEPAKLTRGLASVVEKLGVRIFENTEATALHARRVETSRGEVRAATILSCIEADSGRLLNKREIIPVNSSMIVTEPLAESFWEQIGWSGLECLSDAAHTFIYAQRTADNRIAIGGRGNPYSFNSGTPGLGAVDKRTVGNLLARLEQFFPSHDFAVAHAWRGSIGVTRDWCAGISFDESSRIGVARGFAGHGVTSTNLAARTLLDRAAGLDSPLTRLPWNEHNSGLWEPEPIRWVGVHAMYRLFGLADAWEEGRQSSETSLIARFGSRLAGLHE